MLKRIYNRTGIPDIHFKEINTLNDALVCVVPGTKIKFVGEKKRYECIARDDKYIIVAKPFNLHGYKCIYSILDTSIMKCNRDNLIFGLYNYLSIDDCKTALENLNDETKPFGLSQRGIAKIVDVIDEIWCEVNIKESEEE